MNTKQPVSNKRALMKPFEVVGIAAGCGIFVLLIVLLTIKDLAIGLIFAGIAMVVVLLVLALLLLGYSPNPEAEHFLDRDLEAERREDARAEAAESGAAEAGAAEAGATATTVADGATSEPVDTEAVEPDGEADPGDPETRL